MKKFFTFCGAVLLASQCLNAQSWKLTEMSEETFNDGGDAQWSFEKYSYETGLFTRYTLLSDSCAANYLDWYNPERVDGKFIVDPGDLSKWEGSVAGYRLGETRRAGWCDFICTAGTQNDPATYSYVVRDTREGFGYEIYANGKYSSTITFTAPSDGFYSVKGRVIREDCIPSDAMSLLFKYRYASDENQDYVNPLSNMGVVIRYGASEGDIEGFDGLGTLAAGAHQRFVNQTPVDFTISFQAKAGDKISFEPSIKDCGINDDGKARTCWGRTFIQMLDVEAVDQSVAEADTNYVDPYGTEAYERLTNYFNEISDLYMAASENAGNGYGQYPYEALSAFDKVFVEVDEALQSGLVNVMNANIYYDMLESAWKTLEDSKVQIDFSEGLNNHRLFWTAGDTKMYNEEAVAANSDSPWGFYYHNVSDGKFVKLSKHDTGSKAGSSTTAWYENGGDWMYITDAGFVHPMTNKTPTIMFTAPADHVYKVEVAVSRTNPENNDFAEYLMGHYMTAGTELCDTANWFVRKAFGAKTGSLYTGRDTVTVEMFVNMKAGDKMTFGTECYTAGRNSSCGNEFVRFYVASCLTADVEFTVDSASNSPLEFFDPYKIADMTELKSLYAEITEKYAEIADKLAAPDENGVLPDGMYDATIAEELDNLLETAAGYIEVEDEGIVTQVEADALVLNLNRTFDKLLTSKAPYVVDVQGNWTIRVAGTENRLTRKNSASDNAGVYYYSALWSIDNVVSDANKTGADIADYRWDWTISKHNLSVVDETSGDTKEVEFYTIGNEQGYVTVDGYLREVGEITSYNYANYALEFVKAETTDSLVAIRRMSDRLYWGNGFSWKAPYDKVNTASTPQYVFVLDEQTTTTGIDNNEVASSTAVKTEYYSISGMKVEAPVSGIFIKKVTFDDGRVETSKIYVR